MTVILYIFAAYNIGILLFAYCAPKWYEDKAFRKGVQPDFRRLTISKLFLAGLSTYIGYSLQA